MTPHTGAARSSDGNGIVEDIMKRARVGTVVVWSLAIAVSGPGQISAQELPPASPPVASAPVQAVPIQAVPVQDEPAVPPAPAVPAPPVLVPGLPVPGVAVPAVPAVPAAPTWTPGRRVPVTPAMPWTGVWMDRNGVAYQGTPGAFVGSSGGERRTESTDMPFADPSKPGTLVVDLFSGSIRVKAANRKDVGIRITHAGRASLLPRQAEPPPAGMRRLTPSFQGAPGADAALQDNQLLLRLMNPVIAADLELEVPARTNLNLRVVNGGAIDVEGVEGNLEVNNVNGSIRLQGVAGSVVADAVNGDVTVAMTRVAEQKVMAFSSLNGKIDVTLPRTTKANLKLRSDNGDVFTDFDVAQTKAPPLTTSAPSLQPFQWTGRDTRSSTVLDRPEQSGSGRRSRQPDRNRTIYGTVNGGGPEIDARSFNGAVYIRRGPQ